MNTRVAVIKTITRTLQAVRQSDSNYNGAITYGQALGTIATAADAEAIDYDEFKRLMDLLRNARQHQGYQAPKTEARHAA
tara:strand:+ start:9151 stop:9390 length:240 start_codon:yes stop_codon:yes gene_type:complete